MFENKQLLILQTDFLYLQNSCINIPEHKCKAKHRLKSRFSKSIGSFFSANLSEYVISDKFWSCCICNFQRDLLEFYCAASSVSICFEYFSFSSKRIGEVEEEERICWDEFLKLDISFTHLNSQRVRCVKYCGCFFYRNFCSHSGLPYVLPIENVGNTVKLQR